MTRRATLFAFGALAATAFPGAPVAASIRHPSWHVPAVAREVQSIATPMPVAASATMSEQGGVSRLVFELSSKVDVDAFVIANPPRVVVDLPAIDFRGASLAGTKSTGLVRAFRSGLFAPGRSRVVVDLAGPATLRKASIESTARGDASRLVVELGRTDWASFRAAARRPPAPEAVPAPLVADIRASQPASRRVVVIDAGHGGVDPGASGLLGASEKTIVLDFASELAAKLRAGGRYDVVMTRTDDTFVSLSERVRIARDADAALFVSVHADTLGDPAVTGATVYAPADRASDAEAARVAEVENKSDEVAGIEASPEALGVSDILFDLTRRESRTYAHMFQHTLLGYWQKVARVNKNPERSAGFKVLQAPDVPSVLLELGYLSSDKDALALTSPDWRDRATNSVASAIDAFLSGTASPSADGRGTVPDAGKPAAPPDRIVSAEPHR